MNFNNPYYLADLQQMRDRIDNQMRQIQQPPYQQPNITQNFQLQPQNSNEIDGKYAKNIDDVKNSLVYKNTIFLNENDNLMWLKEVNGKIKTFNLTEVIELDEKDKQIMDLKKEIEELKGMIKNAKSDNVNVIEPIEIRKSAGNEFNNTSNEFKL